MTSLFLGDDALTDSIATDLEWPIDTKWTDHSDGECLTSTTDELLESILRGSCHFEQPTFSDDGSEDSGSLNLGSPSSSSSSSDSLTITKKDEDDEDKLMTADPSLINGLPPLASPERPIVVEVTPLLTPGPKTNKDTTISNRRTSNGVTTILVPTVKAAGQSAQTKVTLLPATKRRQTTVEDRDDAPNKAKVAKNSKESSNREENTNSSINSKFDVNWNSESNETLEASSSSTTPRYPRLVLSEEERRICERDSVRLPTHYPLSREEEKALKRVRRKIRNKVSAQDSRKRKKEYVDAMEDRVKLCASENEQLHKKIEILEKQNRTLAGQLKRLHQLLVNGGVRTTNNNSQTSTAMMVLLLSTALFLIPGMGNQGGRERESELELSQALKMPPLPGQSRSLLHFPDVSVSPKKEEVEEPFMALNDKDGTPGMHDDHDYSVVTEHSNRTRKRLLKMTDNNNYLASEHVVKREVGEGHVERRMVNVTKGDRMGTRTVVLHVPKDIK